MNNTTQAPQDSVLRRHWEASRQAQPSTASASSLNTSTQASSGGFFSWLKSLFS